MIWETTFEVDFDIDPENFTKEQENDLKLALQKTLGIHDPNQIKIEIVEDPDNPGKSKVKYTIAGDYENEIKNNPNFEKEFKKKLKNQNNELSKKLEKIHKAKPGGNKHIINYLWPNININAKALLIFLKIFDSQY